MDSAYPSMVDEFERTKRIGFLFMHSSRLLFVYTHMIETLFCGYFLKKVVVGTDVP